MGLLNLIADIDSYTKIEKQYGIGAADEFLKNRERSKIADKQRQNEQILLRQQQNDYDYEKALKEAINGAVFDMNNVLRKNDMPLTEYETNKLKGLIDQIQYAYNQKTLDEICNEWNDFWYEKELIHFVSIKIKEIQNKLIEFLYNDKESEFSKSKEKDLNIQFEKIYHAHNQKFFMEHLNEMIDYLKNKYDLELDKDTMQIITNEINRIKKDWGKK